MNTAAIPIQISLNHNAIFVTDLKTAADFYENVVGLKPIEEPFKQGRHAWFETGPGTSLHIIAGAPEKKAYYKSHHICFSVHPFNALIEKLNGLGVQWMDSKLNPHSITIRPDGIQQIWIQDPDGYWIEMNDDRQ